MEVGRPGERGSELRAILPIPGFAQLLLTCVAMATARGRMPARMKYVTLQPILSRSHPAWIASPRWSVHRTGENAASLVAPWRLVLDHALQGMSGLPLHPEPPPFIAPARTRDADLPCEDTARFLAARTPLGADTVLIESPRPAAFLADVAPVAHTLHHRGSGRATARSAPPAPPARRRRPGRRCSGSAGWPPGRWPWRRSGPARPAPPLRDARRNPARG